MPGMPAGHDACDKKNGHCKDFPPGRAGSWNGRDGFPDRSIDGRKQAITATREGFNKTGVFCGITESIA